MHSILWRGEERNGKLIGALLIVTVCMSIVIAAGTAVIIDQQNAIARLSNERIMFGFPDEDGIFVSSNTVPESFIIRYAKDFASNLYNYDFRSAKLNMTEARQMMTLEKAEEWTPDFQRKVTQAVEQRIGETLFYTKPPTIKTRSDGYDVSLPARLTRYQGGEVWFDKDVVVEVALKVVEPTKFRKEGLAVLSAKINEEAGR
jgi:hypothetical protein